jgi:hypothetical protein
VAEDEAATNGTAETAAIGRLPAEPRTCEKRPDVSFIVDRGRRTHARARQRTAMSAALEPRGATSRWRRSKRDKGAPKNPPASRDAAPDGPSEAHRTDATGDSAHPRARRGREAPSDDPAEARVDGTEPFANDDSPEGSPAGPLSASELTASSCSGGSCASEDGDGSAAADVGATVENAKTREDAPEEANFDERALSEVSSSPPLVAAASPEDEWPTVGIGARERKRGNARAPAAAAKWRCAGDWPCGACAHANSGWRARCARCGAEKENNGRSRAPAGSNLSADGAVCADGAAFPPLGAATTDDQAASLIAGVRPETKRDPDFTECETNAAAAFFHDAANSSLAGAEFSGAFAGAPPDAIPLEALERAFAETAAETAAVENEKGDAEDASGRTTRAQTTEKPFRWDDEAGEKNGENRDEDAPLPPLPWDKRADASTPDGDAWTPAPDPRINRDPSPDKSSRISKVDDGRHTSVIDALREALRLERDARDAAVHAAVAVARERDFDALREMAEITASHCSARVAFDVEARIAHGAEEASERHADLERRLSEVKRENAKHEATNASLAEQAERLERRLDATEERCVALEGEAARLASLVESGRAESSRVEPSVQTRVGEDVTATTRTSKREETLCRKERVERHRGDASVFVRAEEKDRTRLASAQANSLVKRTRSEAADDDHGTYFEAQLIGGFGSSASVFGAESVTAFSPTGADGVEEELASLLSTETEKSSASKTTPSAKPRNRRRAKKPNAAERRTAFPGDPTENASDSVASVAEEIRAQDVKTHRRRFRESARLRKTKVSFANALDAKKNVALPSTWARAEGFFDASTARAVFLRPST